MASETTVLVCVTCRQGGDPNSRPGARFLEALRAKLTDADAERVRIRPVECLQVCRRPCTAAFAAQGKWTYVLADLELGRIDEFILALRAYTAALDGVAPWKERPDCFKRGVVARTPPPDR